jgi:hypothetical protein
MPLTYISLTVEMALALGALLLIPLLAGASDSKMGITNQFNEVPDEVDIIIAGGKSFSRQPSSALTDISQEELPAASSQQDSAMPTRTCLLLSLSVDMTTTTTPPSTTRCSG